MGKMILYSDWSTAEEEEDIRERYREEYDEDIPDEQLYSYMQAQKECDWDMFRDDLESFFRNNGKYGWIVFGSIGRWNGVSTGGQFFDTLADFDKLDLLEDCDLVEWSADDKGHLYVHGAHHDGHVYLEIRELTAKGRESIDANYGGVNRGITTCNFLSKLPHWEKYSA